MIGRRCIVAVVCLLAAWPAWTQSPWPSRATALAMSAPFILVGTVTEVRARMPEDPYGNHDAVVHVDEVVKGNLPDTIVVRYPGAPDAWPARGAARAEGLPAQQLQRGDRRLFLLAGGSPYRLAHLTRGMLPVERLPELRAALAAFPLKVTLQTDVALLTPASTFTVTVRLTNTGDVPLRVRLPLAFAGCVRFWCWTASALLPAKVLRGTPASLDPSSYIEVILQPGETRESAHAFTVSPTRRLRAPQAVTLVAWVYLLPPDATDPLSIASNPVEVAIATP